KPAFDLPRLISPALPPPPAARFPMRNTRDTQLIFDLSRPGRRGAALPACDVPERAIDSLLPASALAPAPPALPEVNEPQVIRHFVNLSQQNMSVDTHFYPLGSCTMKYNP